MLRAGLPAPMLERSSTGARDRLLIRLVLSGAILKGAMPSHPCHFRTAPLLASALTAGVVAGCLYIPRHLEGVPAGPPYTALPLRSWLAEDRIEPRAVIACMSDECPHRIAVGMFRASGSEADTLAATLKDPDALARALRAEKSPSAASRSRGKKDGARAPVRTAVEARPFGEGDLSGFTLALSRADRKGRPAYGAALARRSGEILDVVLVVGDDDGVVAATALKVAQEDFGR